MVGSETSGEGISGRLLGPERSPVTPPPCSCTVGATAGCLSSDRFQVWVSWPDFRGDSGVGDAVAPRDDTGYFWLLDAANVELAVKVLDGSGFDGHYWVFCGSLSNVGYTLPVPDTVSGEVKTSTDPSVKSGSVGDTEALAVP